MTEPSKFNDDDWAELVRDLEQHQPADQPGDPHLPKSGVEPAEPEEEGPIPGGDEPLDEVEDVEVAEGEQAGEAGGEGQPGTGRKRRRRRRRRRKAGQPAEAGAGDEAEGEKEEGEKEEAEEGADAYEAGTADSEYAEEPAEEMETNETASEAAEEDAGGELLRELIANWNVPSWDEVVGGLHRP